MIEDWDQSTSGGIKQLFVLI